MAVDLVSGVQGETSAGIARCILDWLGSAGSESLTDAESLDLITLMESVKGAAAAVQVRVTAQVVGRRDADSAQARARGEISAADEKRCRAGTRAEIALARRCSPTLADRHVGLAVALDAEMPHTLHALSRGEISEWRATLMVRETACLSADDRREVDRRIGPDLPRLGDRAIVRAAQLIAVERDQESIVERRRRAAASRRVSVRPAADGMAYLSVLGPLTEIVGAYAALTVAERSRWAMTGDPRVDQLRTQDRRGVGEWMADTALERLSGRGEGEVQPVEINLVMTPGALLPSLATGDGADSRVEIPGWGTAPAGDVRAHLARLLADTGRAENGGSRAAGVWLRRLFTSPDGRDLVSMDSSRRRFDGALRTFLALRDPTCRFPWCDAPSRDIDHVARHADGGATSADNGMGLCHRHNQVKELPGWRVTVEAAGAGPPNGSIDRGRWTHAVSIRTPGGRFAWATAPPILGIGTKQDPPMSPGEQYYYDLVVAAA